MKKHFTCLIVFLLFTSIIKSQSLNNLDEKNGFKSYKLGTPISYIENNYKLKKIDDQNTYLVLNNSENSVFDFKVNSILLSFDKNDKLGMITISLEAGQKDGKIGILSPYFENLFGKKTGAGKLNEKGDVYEAWVSKKISLSVNYLYKGYETGWVPLIQISTLDFWKQRNDNGF